MELEIYTAFIKAGVSEAEAKAAVESLNKEIDKRFSLHAQQLFTKADGAELKADVLKSIADTQRWTIAVVFAGMAALAVIQKLL